MESRDRRGKISEITVMHPRESEKEENKGMGRRLRSRDEEAEVGDTITKSKRVEGRGRQGEVAMRNGWLQPNFHSYLLLRRG